MHQSSTLSIGMDVHKESIAVAYVAKEHDAEVISLGTFGTRQCDIDTLIRKLQSKAKHLICVYEAGPCGYGIYRRLNDKADVTCQVVAPSMTPRRPGVRVKTNRRDCLMLAKLLRAEELSPAWVPDEAHEAMRDLVRCRGAVVADQMRCRQRIAGFLLRQPQPP